MLKSVISGLMLTAICSSGWCGTLKDNGDGTVKDLATGLAWQQVYDTVPKNWVTASNYCSDLTLANKSDWQLPNIKQLASIIDYRVGYPAIDETIFPSTTSLASTYFWSRDTVDAVAENAWFVNFFTGNITGGGIKNFVYHARCVR